MGEEGTRGKGTGGEGTEGEGTEWEGSVVESKKILKIDPGRNATRISAWSADFPPAN